MIVYEVDLEISKEIYAEYILWLEEHLRVMLTIQGFKKALYFTSLAHESQSVHKILVHYYVDTINDLERYFTCYATKMRQEAFSKFPNQFRATRHIYHSVSEVNAFKSNQ